jgi:hypothetical protein
MKKLTKNAETLIRTARKQHRCSGGHNGKDNVACNLPIMPREVYIEYMGEATPFHSGARYHIDCAKQQGLITE